MDELLLAHKRERQERMENHNLLLARARAVIEAGRPHEHNIAPGNYVDGIRDRDCPQCKAWDALRDELERQTK